MDNPGQSSMPRRIGEIESLIRYPVKSMKGEPVESASLGWYGLEGDRRLAFRRVGDRSGFPWLTAGRLPELILYAPQRIDPSAGEGLPSHVTTPDGQQLPIFGEELAAHVERHHHSPVEMTYLNRGIFDEASTSLISSSTVREIATLTSQPADIRRFRPNIVIASATGVAFEEDDWVNGVLTFGDDPDAAAIGITNRDERCAMVNFDPDTAKTDPAVLKTIVRVRENRLGVYGTTTRRGLLAVGQPIFFEPAANHR